MVDEVYIAATIKIIDGENKPYLEIDFNGVTINISTNLAEMIGGVGKGARLRHEDLKGLSTKT